MKIDIFFYSIRLDYDCIPVEGYFISFAYDSVKRIFWQGIYFGENFS
ncbi:hypothetical protein [uncultured Duncaniella sp.]|nr:hypothetical protein [uncultured Duncaniella sp.]